MKKGKNKTSNSFISLESSKKTAMKLINKYADSFNTIKEENKQLKKKIEDLETNLKINKSIIQTFFSNISAKEKEESLLSNIKQENSNLYHQIKSLESKISELNTKISLNEQTYMESISHIKTENENYKTKIFLLENSNAKKNNIIHKDKTKLSLMKNGFIYGKNEVYVTNPTRVVNTMNNELLVYKELCENLNTEIKRLKKELERYDKKFIQLQNENLNLRQEYKSYIFSTNKERETLMSTIQNERSQHMRLLTDKNINKKSNKNLNTKDKSKSVDEPVPMLCDSYIIKKMVKKQFEHEDFLEILKNVGLSLDKYEKLSKIKTFNKFAEIIEMLLNLVKEKEHTMNIIKKENMNINSNNFKLNQENIKLNNQIRKLKSIIKNNINTFNNTLGNEQTLSSNKNVILAINNYKNYINNLEKESSTPSDILYDLNKDKLNNNEMNGNNLETDKNVLVKPILEENNENSESKNKNDKEVEENDMTGAVKIPQEIINKNNFISNNKIETFINTNEFQEGCRVESFMSTIKFDDMNGTQKTNGLKETQKFYCGINKNKNKNDEVMDLDNIKINEININNKE